MGRLSKRRFKASRADKLRRLIDAKFATDQEGEKRRIQQLANRELQRCWLTWGNLNRPGITRDYLTNKVKLVRMPRFNPGSVVGLRY